MLVPIRLAETNASSPAGSGTALRVRTYVGSTRGLNVSTKSRWSSWGRTDRPNTIPFLASDTLGISETVLETNTSRLPRTRAVRVRKLRSYDATAPAGGPQ